MTVTPRCYNTSDLSGRDARVSVAASPSTSSSFLPQQTEKPGLCSVQSDRQEPRRTVHSTLDNDDDGDNVHR